MAELAQRMPEAAAHFTAACSRVQRSMEDATAAMNGLNGQLWRVVLDENFGPT
jgi:hypothetical protein